MDPEPGDANPSQGTIHTHPYGHVYGQWEETGDLEETDADTDTGNIQNSQALLLHKI